MQRTDSLRGFTADELAVLLSGELVPAKSSFTGPFFPAAPPDAGRDRVCVAFDARALEEAVTAGAGLVIIQDSLKAKCLEAKLSALVVADARLALAGLSAASAAGLPPIHPASGAAVAASARIDPSARLSAGVTVGEHAVVGPNVTLGPGTTIGANSAVGADSLLHAGVHVYDHVTLGKRVIVHSGAVIGADGFGFVTTGSGPVKLHHLGTVTIADDVEIGANSAVDRGVLGATAIGPRTKIDNHVQVGHNVEIGEECMIAGHVAIGGSARIGNRVTLAGNSSVSDHVSIGDGATLAGMSGLSRNLPTEEVWFGIPAMPIRRFTRRQYLLSRLEEIWHFVRERRKQ